MDSGSLATSPTPPDKLLPASCGSDRTETLAVKSPNIHSLVAEESQYSNPPAAMAQMTDSFRVPQGLNQPDASYYLNPTSFPAAYQHGSSGTDAMLNYWLPQECVTEDNLDYSIQHEVGVPTACSDDDSCNSASYVNYESSSMSQHIQPSMYAWEEDLMLYSSPQVSNNIDKLHYRSYDDYPFNAEQDYIPENLTYDSYDSNASSYAETPTSPPDEVQDDIKDLPYAQLIFRCLLEAPDHAAVLQDIYKWFLLNTNKAQDTKNTGWRNSIRHNLSMNKAFLKTAITEDGGAKKSYIWKLDPAAVMDGVQSTTRFRNKQPHKRGAKTPHPHPYQNAKVLAGQRGGEKARAAACARRSERLRQLQNQRPQMEHQPESRMFNFKPASGTSHPYSYASRYEGLGLQRNQSVEKVDHEQLEMQLDPLLLPHSLPSTPSLYMQDFDSNSDSPFGSGSPIPPLIFDAQIMPAKWCADSMDPFGNEYTSYYTSTGDTNQGNEVTSTGHMWPGCLDTSFPFGPT